MDDWHNMTVQGQRNTAVSKRMQARADREMANWRKRQRREFGVSADIPLKEPQKFEGKGRRRRRKMAQRNG